jgi:thiosulfate/3-mercaptopyruvate sulfurtransferase
VTEGPLVATAWLAAHLTDASLRVVDVRWYLDPTRHGRAAYDAGHIPGARFMDLDADLAAPGGQKGGGLGRHPWPSPEQVADVMGKAGIDQSTFVVAYDDQAGAIAARLWYVLRAHGHRSVAVLDGGITKWVAEGRPLSTDVPPIEHRIFVPRFDPAWVVSKQQMIDRDPRELVIDARASERYRGEQEPIDSQAGHIPGAINVPYASNFTGGPVPVMRPADELRELYAGVGADERRPIVYCGSGVTSCHTVLALKRAGLPATLYPGSWSEWSSDPSLPVKTGAD